MAKDLAVVSQATLVITGQASLLSLSILLFTSGNLEM